MATSGFGHKRGPFVTLSLNGADLIQMDVEEARSHAMAVLECAEAAETDGYIVDYARRNFIAEGESPELASRQLAAILMDYRAYRDVLRLKKVN